MFHVLHSSYLKPSIRQLKKNKAIKGNLERICRHDAEHLLKRMKTWIIRESNEESGITWLKSKRRVQSLQRKTSNALTARLIWDEEKNQKDHCKSFLPNKIEWNLNFDDLENLFFPFVYSLHDFLCLLNLVSRFCRNSSCYFVIRKIMFIRNLFPTSCWWCWVRKHSK